MEVIYRILFVALLLAQLPFLAAQEAANPDSRAEELRERRRQNLPERTPPEEPRRSENASLHGRRGSL